MNRIIVFDNKQIVIDEALASEFEQATCEKIDTCAESYLNMLRRKHPTDSISELAIRLTEMLREEVSIYKGEA